MSENKNIEFLKFGGYKMPQPYEPLQKSLDRHQPYGVDNLYPYYLLDLYHQSPLHSSIVNQKANFIIGNGLKTKSGKPVALKVNAQDSIEEFISKVVLDYLIFNYFCIEVIYNSFNQPIEYHFVDAHRVRTNQNKSKFWVSDDWALNQKPILFDRWQLNNKDQTSKIFFFDGYFPSKRRVYPIPEYEGLRLSIQTDIAIREFNLNNIENHFSVSTLITFYKGGNVPDEVRQKILKDLTASYTGSTGKKMIVDFQELTGQSADVKNISPGDWDKAYELVAKNVKDDIMQGHGVTSPLLFGFKTEGQLGGTTELEIAYEILKNNYITKKRKEIESALNFLFSGFEKINENVEFTDKPLFSTRISEETKEKIYTINELRKEAGLPALQNGDRLLNEPAPAVEPVAQGKFSTNYHLTDEDFEKIKDFGIAQEEFEFIAEEGTGITSHEDFSRVEYQFDTVQDIADYILKNDVAGKSINDLKKDLRKELNINITSDYLNKALKQLNDAGVININIADGKIEVKPIEKESPKRTIQVMYTYEVRPGLGEPIIDKTRPFCKKLINNNRLYAREDIQKMTSIFGYDIFRLGGGYYRNPDTGELTTHCRHQFVARTVSRKAK